MLQINTYDAVGNLIRRTDGAEGGAAFSYNLAGDRTTIQSTGNATQEFLYDARGNITGVIDGNRNRTEYALDAWGRVAEIRKADGSTEQYAYDHAGNILRSVDGEGNETTYAYDCAGNLTAVTDALGYTEQYAYDKEGRLAEKTDKNGVTTTYAFNFYGAPLYRREKGSLQGDFYEYTPEGLLKSAISERMAYSYTYDAMGRLSKKSASGRTLLSLEYDGNGNRTRQTDVTGKITEYRFDLLDRLTEVWDNGEKLAEYGYYPDGTIQREIHGPLTKEYAYDADRNLTGLNIQCGDSLLADNRYTYDGNGNRLEKQQLSGTTRYAYDALNQLVKAEYPTYGEELFYDRAGNRTRRRSAGVEEVYAYDAGNHLTKLTRNGADISFQYDRAGNLLNDDRAAYSYDVFNRQTSVETFDGNIQINHYDAEGLRHEMEENGKLVQFIFRGTEVVVEETQEENIRYIRTHELLASDAESARTYYHYASDEMGSITHVTDEEGNILNRYEYDAWGNLTAAEEQVPNRFKYTGEQFDAITQQYYLRARFYNPALARFMQEDTYRGDGLNLYAYCANNPVIYVDPSGHWCKVKQNVYERLVRENGLDINNIDPDTKLRFMAEASNIVKGFNVEQNKTPIELPGVIDTELNRPEAPRAEIDVSGTGGREPAAGFNDWLNKGNEDNKVYFGIKDDIAQYTGITNQILAARLRQHNAKNNPKRKGFQRLDEQFSNLTRNQARAIEQYFIENGPNALNEINSIRNSHRYYKDAMNWAKQYLKERGVDVNDGYK